jgi:VCBS repeat-containing protein
VVSVDFGGTPHDVTGGNATIVGDFGTLEINSDGTYTYTPDTANDTDGTDSFAVTVEDTIDGGQVNADLDITVDVQDTEAAPLAPATANAIMLDGMEDPSGDDTDPSATGEKVELADNLLLDDAAPTIDLGDEIRSELEDLASLIAQRIEESAPDLQNLLMERFDQFAELLPEFNKQQLNDEQPI